MMKSYLPVIALQLSFNLFATSTTIVNENNIGEINFVQIINSIALIYTDDRLDPIVEKFINNQPEIIWEDNAYVYLWGMDINTDSPYEIGKEILEKLLVEDSLYNYERHPLDLSFLNDFSIHAIPENDLLCKKHKKECFEQITSNDEKVVLLLSEYGFYIPRYHSFLKFNHYKQIGDRRMESPVPNYRTIIIAQNLYHISLLSNLEKQPEIELIEALEKELNQLKNKLKHADTLIAKMIVLALINENVEMINYLHQKKKIDLDTHLLVFKPFTPSQQSLYNAMYEELSKTLKHMFDLISEPNNFTKKKYKPITVQLMKLISFFVAKPNLTANTVYNDYVTNLLYLTQLPSSEYYKEIEKPTIAINHDPIRNYMVYKLLDGILPDYYEYQMRVFDINMKLQLMRLIIQSKSTDKLKQSNEFLSSYDQTPSFKKNDKICYSGIAKMFPEFRCLIIY